MLFPPTSTDGQSKGKSKAVYNPLSEPKPKKKKKSVIPSIGTSTNTTATKQAVSLLDPSIDPSTMAPSTLVLALRKQRRDLKRLERSETRRSNLRASTLKTDAEIEEREKQEKTIVHRKGRVAMHKGGEARGVRNYTQAELIAEALEEEERNKEELQKWLRREEERRELRRVGRKRVRGPRWTWISRTVGKLVEVIEDGDGTKAKDVEVSQASERDGPEEAGPSGTSGSAVERTHEDASALAEPVDEDTRAAQSAGETEQEGPTLPAAIGKEEEGVKARDVQIAPTPTPNSLPTANPAEPVASSSTPLEPFTNNPVAPPLLQSRSTPVQPESSQYTRNYLILSQIPGGLPAELALVLGNHVEWDQVKYIPARNRPIIRRRPRCPFTGKVAKYRHPATMIPYADVGGYQQIEALLQNRYMWSEGGFWLGSEEDVGASGTEELEGWSEAVNGGWMAGFPIPIPEEEQPEGGVLETVEEVGPAEIPKKGRKRGPKAAVGSSPAGSPASTRGKRRRK
jgi:vacuolar protein sorting-associated protein 72